MYQLTAPEQQALQDVATQVGADPASLYKLILFESGWNPAAKNPTSSARGLIQFIDSTAQSLGYGDSLDLVTKHPTIEGQLRGPVATYLQQWGPLDSEQALFMAVFYPAARTWDPNDTFPGWVTEANPGIATPADYMDAVYAAQPVTDEQVAKAIGILPAAGMGLGLVAIAGAIIALWYMSTNT